MFKQKGNSTCVTWRDRKPVTFLSTIPTSITNSNLAQRSVKENGQWIQKDFARPGIVDLYNTYMGGVDVSDQRAVTYARLIKGVVWYYKVFFYMVEVCVSNAYILHTKSPNNTNMRRFDFRRELVSQNWRIGEETLRQHQKTDQTMSNRTHWKAAWMHHVLSWSLMKAKLKHKYTAAEQSQTYLQYQTKILYKMEQHCNDDR